MLPTVAVRPGTASRTVALLSLSKLVNDSYLSFLSALLPLISTRDSLSLAEAGSLATALSFASMVPQPLFGLASRRSPRTLLVIGPAAVAIGTAAMLLVRGYLPLLLTMVVTGLGAAAFNPIAAALAGEATTGRRGFGLGLLTAAGQLGRCLGPVIVIFLVRSLGFELTSLAGVGGLTMAYLLLGEFRRFSYRPLAIRTGRAASGRLTSLSVLWALMALRAATFGILSVYLPIYLYSHGHSLLVGGVAIAVLQLAGAVTTFAGGRLSDRLGRRRVIVGSFALAVLPILLAWQFTTAITVVLLIVGGGLVMVSLSVTLTFGQELYPNDAALVSGVLTGLGWGVGSLAMLGTGFLADSYGLREVLGYLFLLPTVGALLAASLLKEVPET